MNSHTNLAKNHSLIVGVEMVQKKSVRIEEDERKKTPPLILGDYLVVWSLENKKGN